jgi:hypothetical protein
VVTPQPLGNSATSSTVSSVAPSSREPRLPPLERFNGEQSTGWAFIALCALVFKLQPSSFPSDHSKIAYLITLMSGRALTWATAVWEQQSAICISLEGFVGEVKKVFDAPFSGREAARKLIQLWQDSRSVGDYAVDFRKLAG